MTATRAQQTISLALDMRLPLESLLLNRLAKIPTQRQSDWLRTLLVSGFCLECQVLKAGQRERGLLAAKEVPIKHVTGQVQGAYADWLASRRCVDKRKTPTSDAPVFRHSPVAKSGSQRTGTPFTHLRKVMGE